MSPNQTPAPQPPGPLADPVAGRRLPEDIHELARSGLEQAVPFNLHNNVSILEVGTTYGVAEIPDAPHLKNHLGTQHGAALFAVAEAAAGTAYAGAFLEQLRGRWDPERASARPVDLEDIAALTALDVEGPER